MSPILRTRLAYFEACSCCMYNGHAKTGNPTDQAWDVHIRRGQMWNASVSPFFRSGVVTTEQYKTSLNACTTARLRKNSSEFHRNYDRFFLRYARFPCQFPAALLIYNLIIVLNY